MKNKLINLAKEKNIKIEIYENKSNTTNISILNEQEKNYQITNVNSYIVKAIKNGKCAKLVTESLNKPEKILCNLETILKIQDNDNENHLSIGNIIKENKDNENINYNNVKNDLKSLYKLKENNPELANIELEYEHVNLGTFIKNENCNMKSSDYFNIFSVGVSVSAKEKSKASYITYYSKNYNFRDFYNLISKTLDGLKIKLNSTSCKTNKYNIIIKNNVVTDILSYFVSMFFTKNIMQNESVLADKFNKKIFNEKINILEDPYGESNMYKKYFDSEGTKTTFKKIVDKGIFVQKLNNIEYSIKSNEYATGNADGVNNMYVAPGNASFSKLIEKLDNGIIIDDVSGLHSGIDIKSGNISVPVNGYLVENGKIVKGLEMIILSTNIFELFSNVVEVGNDLSSNSLTISAPSLLFKTITIAGKE